MRGAGSQNRRIPYFKTSSTSLLQLLAAHGPCNCCASGSRARSLPFSLPGRPHERSRPCFERHDCASPLQSHAQTRRGQKSSEHDARSPLISDNERSELGGSVRLGSLPRSAAHCPKRAIAAASERASEPSQGVHLVLTLQNSGTLRCQSINQAVITSITIHTTAHRIPRSVARSKIIGFGSQKGKGNRPLCMLPFPYYYLSRT